MKYLAAQLKHRIQIMKGEKIPSYAGYKTSYKMLVRLWAGIKNKNQDGGEGVQPIRDQNIGGMDTHEFIVRYISVIGKTNRVFGDAFDVSFPSTMTKGLGRQYDLAFSTAFDSMVDINPIKADYFIYMENTNAYNGRLFKINRIIRDDNHKEFAIIKCTEIEEKGTGATN